MKKNLKNNKKGFSLVELVVVMAIMAILTAVAVPMLTSSANSKTKDKYKQYCVSILDSASYITDAFNKGVSSTAGYTIAQTNGQPDWNGIAQCLNSDNPYNYKFKVTCETHYTVSEFNRLSGSSNPRGDDHKDMDTVVVCFVYNDLERSITPVGAWYIKKAVTQPAYKYDYIKGQGIENTEKFSFKTD